MKKGTKKGSKKQGKKLDVEKTQAEGITKEETGLETKPEKQAKVTVDLDALRKPVEEAKAVFTAAEVEANTLESEARDIRIQAKAAFQEILAPYREACRRAKVECEFGGTRRADIAERVFFLVEKVKDGLKVAIKGRPETEEVIPLKNLKESVNKAAYAFVGRWVGDRLVAGNKGGYVQGCSYGESSFFSAGKSQKAC